MKLKYYLRGLGIGIIVTTLILVFAFSRQTTEISDEEIIKRAETLGMVMKEDRLFGKNSSTEVSAESEMHTEVEENADLETERVTDTLAETETASDMDTEEMETTVRETYHITIPPGAVPRQFCNELQENGVIADAESLRKYLSEVGFAKLIQPGEYDIPYGADNEEIYQILKAESER